MALFIYSQQSNSMEQPLTKVNNSLIAPGQAFFTKARNSNGQIEINKESLHSKEYFLQISYQIF